MDALFDGEVYAGLVWRFLAYSIDIFVLFALVLATQFPLLRRRGRREMSGVALHGWVFASVSVPIWFYFALFWSSAWQATPGMRAVGIDVGDLAGARIGFWPALVRAVVLLVPFEINHATMFHPRPIWSDPHAGFRAGFVLVWVVIMAYVALVFMTEHRQSLHDLIAGTTVRVAG